jgi:hypothetical protein
LNFNLTRPCAECPFRTDVRPYLNRVRVRELEQSIVGAQQSFPCHKTTVASDDDDCEMTTTSESEHCAGAMILLEGLNQPNQMMRIAERLGMYDHRKLDMGSPVFNTFESMRKAQPR